MLNELMAFRLMSWLMNAMQLSILLPMAIVWGRRRHYAAPMRSLSWYVYLSAFASLGAEFSAPYFLPNNFAFTFGFNLGKVALFGWVYSQVLTSPRLRQLIVSAVILALLGMFGTFVYEPLLGMAVARVTQCALLAAFAILYLDQYFNQKAPRTASQDPFWLLSVGQLIYSAGTVTAFSLDYLTKTLYQQTSKYLFVAVAGLVFNYFLTMAFLRAKPASSSQEDYPASGSQLASS